MFVILISARSLLRQTTEVSYIPSENIQAHSVNNTINVHPHLDCNSIKSRKHQTLQSILTLISTRSHCFIISKLHKSKQPTTPLNFKYPTNIVSFRFGLFFIAASSDHERDVDNTRRPLFKRVKCKLHVTPAFS